MTRKRYIKKCMALGYSSNKANWLARTAKDSYRQDLFFVIASSHVWNNA